MTEIYFGILNPLFKFSGAKDYVELGYLFLYGMGYYTMVVCPIAVAMTSMARPCMPPAFTMGILPCENWEHDGGASLQLRIFVGLVTCLLWWVAVSGVTFVLETCIVYPSGISAIWVNLILK